MKARLKFAVGAAACLMSVPTLALAATTQVHVKKGDSLYSIAVQNHTSVQAIMTANHLHSSLIHPGQVLKIPHPATKKPKSTAIHRTTTTYHAAPSHPAGPVWKVKVTSGDTLWGIASAYGVSVQGLESWNHLSTRSVLHLGQWLVVYGGHEPKRPTVTRPASSKLSGRSGGNATGTVGTGVLGLNVVSYAKRFLGVPYVWGGESSRGFDCSGLVQFTFAHFGVYLPRDSFSQYNVGRPVSEANLLPGDLVFFDSDGGGASHVGIYVGGGAFINAAGSHVQIDSIWSSYWSSHYVGAKRVL